MEQKEQKAKVVLEVDGERKEFESGTVLVIVHHEKGTYTNAVCRGGGKEFFELYRNTKKLVEEWEKEEPKLLELYTSWEEIEAHLKKIGINLDAGGDDDE